MAIQKYVRTLGLLLGAAVLLGTSSGVLAHARLQVVHAAPFADSVEGTSVTVTANGVEVVSDFQFGDFTDYVTVPAGSYDIEVTPTGADAPAIAATVALENDVDYTALAIGDGVNQPLTLWALVDTVEAPADGNLNIRVVHAAPFGATSEGTEVSVRTAGGAVVNNLVGVPYFAESGFFEVPAGTYDLKVASNDGLTNLIDPVAADLPAGAKVTLVAIGDGSNLPLGILAVPVGVLPTRLVVDNSVTGWWQSLNTGREGFILQPIPAENRLVGTIYSWDPEGSGDPRWFTFDGPFADREAVVEVQAFAGGEFGGENDIDPVVAGTVAFEFLDCDTAVAALVLTDGTEFTWNLGRLVGTLPCNLD